VTGLALAVVVAGVAELALVVVAVTEFALGGVEVAGVEVVFAVSGVPEFVLEEVIGTVEVLALVLSAPCET